MSLPRLRDLRARSLKLSLVMLALALVTGGCSAEEEEPEDVTGETDPPPEATPDTASVEQLTFAVTTEERNLTPWTQDTGYPGYYMMTLVYDTLFWLDENLEPQPWLVEDWEVSEDGLTWELTLHDDVTWHDGEPLTSSDVAFTIDYLTEHPRPRFAPTFEPIESIDTPDEQTVVFTLNAPQASFILRPLADLPILPEHVWTEVDDPFEVTDEPPIGSGPYALAEFVPGELWRFEANPDYFMGEPLVGEILMPFIAETTAAHLAVQTGEADAVTAPLTPELIDQFEEQTDVELVEGAGFRGFYLIMNTERPPFDDPDMRRALQLALDVDDLVETVTLGTGTPGSPGFVHREAPWANPDTLEHERDVDAANEILDGLGYERGDDGVRQTAEGRLSYDLLVRSDAAEQVRTAELISEWASEVGIDLTVTTAEQATLTEQMWPDQPRGQFQGDYFIGVHSWAGVIHFDPDYLIGLFHSDPERGGLSRTGYANPDFDALAEEQERTVDQEERYELLHQMQEILAEEAPAVALYFPAEIVPYRPETFDRWVPYAEGILNKANFVEQ